MNESRIADIFRHILSEKKIQIEKSSISNIIISINA